MEENSYSSRFESHFYSKTDEKIILAELLAKHFGGRKFHNALDVGCGPGKLTEHIQKHCDHLTLVEINPDYKNELKKKFPKAEIIINSINEEKFKNKSFDLIILSHVLYYQNESEWLPFCREMYDLLSSKGVLVIILNRDSGDWWDIYSRYKNKYRDFVVRYLPLTDFKKTLYSLKGTVKVEEYKSALVFESFNGVAECIGKLILGIGNQTIFEKNIDEFKKIAEGIIKKHKANILVFESELIIIEKS